MIPWRGRREQRGQSRLGRRCAFRGIGGGPGLCGKQRLTELLLRLLLQLPLHLLLQSSLQRGQSGQDEALHPLVLNASAVVAHAEKRRLPVLSPNPSPPSKSCYLGTLCAEEEEPALGVPTSML